MRNSLHTLILIMVSLFLLNTCEAYSQAAKLTRIISKKLDRWENPFPEWQDIAKPKLDSSGINIKDNIINLYYSPGLSYYPFREESYNTMIQSIRKALGRRLRKYKLEVFTGHSALNQLIPNYYRKVTALDSTRLPVQTKKRSALVRKLNVPEPGKGLAGNTIALWASHGYYFEMNLDRWEWQRARLFGTVEDISVTGYVQPYLTAMLENSGANVFLPRERDTQIHEVIVDNDKSTGASEVVIHLNSNSRTINEGFLLTDTLFAGYNPFKHGTSLQILNDSATYVPEFTEKGYYAVYASYPQRQDNDSSVLYSVSHTGGKTDFIVNQTIGGETWIYLGTFQFNEGKDINTGSVKIKGLNKDKYVALDAIRFGGGMGNVARKPSPGTLKNQLSVNVNQPVKIKDTTGNKQFEWKLSGKPRFLEAARYYLQYAGMPDSVYSPNKYKNDYNDDYQSRGIWVNYLSGKAIKPGDNKGSAGAGLNVDLSFALHTDAGITPDDSVIGTLGIYSTGAGKGKFPDGVSRMASRDYSDILQTQVVDDIRKLFDAQWTRRGLWDKPYSEARTPGVPAMLMELLSHQNLADQKFGLDPRFRFQVSRSIYKGMLKYLSYVEKRDYVVQPVPVTGFAIVPVTGKKIRLSWEPGIDNTEPTSKPERYLIYKRTGDNGFDNGTLVEKTWCEIELNSWDEIYSFKVAALNEGGASFDSEILSVGIKSGDSDRVLIVNGFDRISGPAWFDENKMAGIAWWKDRGVADHFDIQSVGCQYDFDRKSLWLDDDSPGWGASYGDMEGEIIPGNNFDYPVIHGKAILSAGHSFYSVSNKYFCSDNYDISSFKNVDMIFGEEKATPFFNDTSRIDFRIYTPAFMSRISKLSASGVNLFISGAYIGSDQVIPGDSSIIKFSSQFLHFVPRTGHAVRNGNVYSTDYAKPLFRDTFSFNTGYSKNIYSVEAPDAIEPAGKGALCAFRYSENNTSAGVAFSGSYKTVSLGFPFETIVSDEDRTLLMKEILNYFKK